MSEINALNRKHDLNHNILKNGNHSNGKTADITEIADQLSELTIPKVQCIKSFLLFTLNIHSKIKP